MSQTLPARSQTAPPPPAAPAPAGDENDLPEGWAVTLLDDFGTIYCGQSPSVKDVNAKGEGTPYVTGPEQWDGESIHASKWTTDPRRVVPDGCIFITVKGAGVGTLFPGKACAIGRDIYAFHPTSPAANPAPTNPRAFCWNEFGPVPAVLQRRRLPAAGRSLRPSGTIDNRPPFPRWVCWQMIPTSPGRDDRDPRVVATLAVSLR